MAQGLADTAKEETFKSSDGQRAKTTVDAMAHATGVYFPDRLHEARIAIKKLRYGIEIVDNTAAADRRSAIQELKKAQDLLGDIHDRQELIDHLVQLADGAPDAAERVALLRQVIEAEIYELHARYLARRESLLDICRQQRPTLRPATLNPALLTAAAAALSTGVIALHRRRIS